MIGNLDPHPWNKTKCFAPILSAMDLCFLINLSTKNKCVPKTCHVSQDFCPAYLLPEEKYVCTPPVGDTFTPPKSYLLLKKTLYSLKHSPHHWYKIATNNLTRIGLTESLHFPYIFHVTLITGELPLCLGLYVDDLIYFSSSKTVEEHFKASFHKKNQGKIQQSSISVPGHQTY